MQALYLLNLIVPVVMVSVGVSLKKHPALDMSRQNGYNTRTSRKSQAHWDYAQQIAPEMFVSLGKYLFVLEIAVSILLLFLSVSVWYAVNIGSGIGVIGLVCGFYLTDKKIKEKFAGN